MLHRCFFNNGERSFKVNQMKIIANTNDVQFLISVSDKEFKHILGITSYRISETLDVNKQILENTELQISNNYQNGERIKAIVNREAFKKAKQDLAYAIEILDDAEKKFSNLKMTVEQ